MSVICRVANLSSHIRMVLHTHYFVLFHWCYVYLREFDYLMLKITCFHTNNFVDEPTKVWNIFCFCFAGCLVVTCKVYWAVGSTREGLNPNPIVLGFAGLLTFLWKVGICLFGLEFDWPFWILIGWLYFICNKIMG